MKLQRIDTLSARGQRTIDNFFSGRDLRDGVHTGSFYNRRNTFQSVVVYFNQYDMEELRAIKKELGLKNLPETLRTLATWGAESIGKEEP